MKVDIDLEACVGHGRCYAWQPELFRPIDDEGRTEVAVDIESSSLPNLRERLVQAAENCPESAITIIG